MFPIAVRGNAGAAAAGSEGKGWPGMRRSGRQQGCVVGGRKEVTALSGDSKVSPGLLGCLMRWFPYRWAIGSVRRVSDMGTGDHEVQSKVMSS